MRNFPTSEGDTARPDPRTLPGTLLAKFTTDPAANTIGVRLTEAAEPGEVAFVQSVQGWQRDRRGRAGLASLGILLDVAAGSGIYLLRPENEYVVSHISVSMVPWAVIGDEVTASSSPLAVDDHTGTGLATARMESGGALIASARCRSAQTVRPNLPEDMLTGFRTDPAAFDAGQPLTTHLGLARVDDGSAPDRFRIRWQVPEWALNSLGTAQGGSILSAAAAVTDIIGDTLLGDGSDDYALTDPADILPHIREQREDAALAVIVGTQYEQHVLHGDDDDQRPEEPRFALHGRTLPKKPRVRARAPRRPGRASAALWPRASAFEQRPQKAAIFPRPTAARQRCDG